MREIFLKKSEEDVFLVFEMRIEGPTGLAGGGADLFQAGLLKAIPRKDKAGGGQQFAPGRTGARLPSRWLLRVCIPATQ